MPRSSCHVLLHSLAFLACAGMTGCGNSGRNLQGIAADGNEPSAVTGQIPGPSPLQAVNSSPIQVASEDVRARTLFAALVSPSNPQVDWDQTLEQLLAEGASATRVLAEKLSGGTDPEREMAATTLALIGPEAAGAAKELEKALDDPLPFVQANAAATLIQLPDHSQQAIPALTRLLLAEDQQLRQLAAVNLNAAGVVLTEHVTPLRQVLQHEQSNDVLTPVVELLGRIGKPAEAALPDLKKIADEQPGDLGSAATSAIQLISGETESSPADSP